MSEISVKITKFKDRKFWLMYYDDPITGKRPTRSTKETSEAGAHKAAGKWQAELREGRYKAKSNFTWAEFRERFIEERLANAPKKTFAAYVTALNAVERFVKINRLAELDRHRLKFVADSLAQNGTRPASIGCYLRHLLAALNWALEQGMLAAVPTIAMPKGATGKMKGRPITLEEFERMLAKIPAVLAQPRKIKSKDDAKPKRKLSEEVQGQRRERREASARAAAPSWERLLWGLWLSGLRLGEALALTWDDDTKPIVDLNGRRPMLFIPAACQKGNRDTQTAITPDFYDHLIKTPKTDRTGRVFPVTGPTGNLLIDENKVGRIISDVGEAAGVVVDKAAGKFASAHDLRRSFGSRWSTKVMPAVLKEQMRHRSIQTTMQHYVGQNAEQTADAIWEAAGRVNTFVNSDRKRVEHQQDDQVANQSGTTS